MPIPKIIHFIWAGGSRLMPNKNLEIVLDWLEQNPGFDIYFWVDEKSSGSNNLVNDYRDKLEKIKAGRESISDITVEPESKPEPESKSEPESLLRWSVKSILKLINITKDLGQISIQFKGKQTGKIIFKDIANEGVHDEFTHYEIDKLRPNYGASSDRLRYKILHKYGGAYFDSDVNLVKIPWLKVEYLVLLLQMTMYCT